MRKQLVRMLPEPLKTVLRGLVIYPLRTYFRYFPVRSGKRQVWHLVCEHLWWLESHANAKTIFGSTLHVDARDIGGRLIYYFGVWEPQLTAWIAGCLKPGDGFIDVGANMGYFSLLAAGLVGATGKVVAIEAVPRTFNLLRHNLDANNAANVRPLNVAAWDRQETLTMFIEPSRITGTSTLVPAWAEKWSLGGHCEVPADALAVLLQPDEIRLARFIKIDVEGAEWRVVSGMIPMLAIARRDVEVIIEIATELEVEGKTYRDVFSLFGQAGFFPYLIGNDYSPASYIANAPGNRPRRIEEIPHGVDQIDVIFSRRDEVSL
jgi:FkbM family methyltransferase